ncbi:DNA polymerase III subunit gamma/tau [bacterium]|nr:DNA polymerase III subunit gamma/tau [bacterium]
MVYIVLARKWRPKTFEEVVGQEHITKTLAGAIKQNRVSHAYLFSGPRGIGKTTTARLLAKALNCEKGPTSVPCNKCTHCKEIAIGSSLDVLEIDGASNRGIDEMRDLREKVKFAPASSKYKVYIIDEVHMLTTEAFNALLKTLEEPPPHVIFILATTAPFKLPLTILSRCQRFDFRRIKSKDIVEKLAEIAKDEKLEISEDILFQIAQASEGSMRDGISVLDQLISLGGKKVTQEDLQAILGIVPQETFFKLTKSLVENNTKGALDLINQIIDQGYDIRHFTTDLLKHFRNLLMLKINEEIVDLPKDLKERLKEFRERFDQDRLLRMIEIVSQAREEMKRSERVRLILEMAVVKLTRLKLTVSVDEILGKIESIEERLGIMPAQEELSIEEVPTRLRRGFGGQEEGAPAEKIKDETSYPPTLNLRRAGLELGGIKDAWGEVVKEIRKDSAVTGAFLMEGEPIALKDDLLTIGFNEDFKFHKEQIEERENKELIQKALNKVFGKEFTIECRLTNIPRARSETVAQKGMAMSKEEFIEKEPVVKEALDIFGGEILEIKPSTGKVIPPEENKK